MIPQAQISKFSQRSMDPLVRSHVPASLILNFFRNHDFVLLTLKLDKRWKLPGTKQLSIFTLGVSIYNSSPTDTILELKVTCLVLSSYTTAI